MTELLASFGATPEVAGRRAAVEAPRTPVLITEQQVLFATAAAVPLQPEQTGRRWTGAVLALLTAAFVKADNTTQPKRRHYPSRQAYLEDSRMAREMMRL